MVCSPYDARICKSIPGIAKNLRTRIFRKSRDDGWEYRRARNVNVKSASFLCVEAWKRGVMSVLVSRRSLLATLASATGGAAMVIAVAAPARAADTASQLRKEDVRYQDQPKGNQRCAGCKNFVGPSGCRVVSGNVNPNGWCLLFQANSK
jgi:hypothetical protein